MNIERRKFKRVFFNPEDRVIINLSFLGETRESLPVTVLNVSEGGLGFVAVRDKAQKITKGTQLLIDRIVLPGKEDIIDNVEAITRYVMDLQTYDHITFGCEFIKISENDREKIRDFVSASFSSM